MTLSGLIYLDMDFCLGTIIGSPRHTLRHPSRDHASAAPANSSTLFLLSGTYESSRTFEKFAMTHKWFSLRALAFGLWSIDVQPDLNLLAPRNGYVALCARHGNRLAT